MKVSFVTINYWPSVGGAQLLVQRVAEGLVQRQHDVDVLTVDALRATGGPDPGSVGIAEEVLHGVNVRRARLATRLSSAVRNIRRVEKRLTGRQSEASQILGIGPLAPRLYSAMWRAVRHSDAVVVVNTPLLIVVASWMARVTRRPFIAMPLLHPTDPVYAAVVRALRRADALICLTEHERMWLAQRGVPEERLEVIPPGCEIDTEAPIEPDQARRSLGLPERPTVGFIGRLAPHKGVETFLRSAALMRSADDRRVRDVGFLMAGSRTSWDELDGLLAPALAEPDPVAVLIEEFTDADKLAIYQACDLVVFPSRSESFGIVILEAWAAGRTVIASDIGAIACVIRDGIDGLLVPVDDPRALADAISELVVDPSRRESLASAGQHRIEAEFRWGPIVERWEAVLHPHSSPTQGSGRLTEVG